MVEQWPLFAQRISPIRFSKSYARVLANQTLKILNYFVAF